MRSDRPLELREGLQHAFVQLVDGALGRGVEAPNGFDLIAKKLKTHGLRLIGRKNVQNSASNGVFTRPFHRIATLVADAFEMRRQIVEANLFVETEGKC